MLDSKDADCYCPKAFTMLRLIKCSFDLIIATLLLVGYPDVSDMVFGMHGIGPGCAEGVYTR